VKVLATMLLTFAVGCATARKPPWVPAEGRFVAPKAGFELEGPAGWMRYGPAEAAEEFLATRDGVDLQRINALSSPAGKPLGLGKSTRPFTAGMSPSELAELVVDAVRSVEAISDVRVIENMPAKLAGRSGFRLLVSYKADGLTYRTAIAGCAEGERVYYAYYRAPERHYFDLDLATFDLVLETYRLDAPEPAPKPSPPPQS